MKRMANHYFRRNESAFTLPEEPFGNSRLSPLESKRNGEEKKIAKNTEEPGNKREHLTATYWG